jgi:ATP-binding cassette, subfamily F, member 1
MNNIEDINITYQSITTQEAISIKDLCLSIGSKHLLQDTSLVINPGINYGIIAPNGHGKSTLLLALAYKLNITNFQIHMVRQENHSSELSVLQEVLHSNTELQHYLSKEKELNHLLDTCKDEEVEEISEELENLYQQAETFGFNSMESEAAKILAGLGFDIKSPQGNMQERKVNDYSGGWRMRVSLAKALFNKPDLLILDEPTNHLDLNAVIWLSNYLQTWNTSKNTNKKSLLLVSHDEDFIDGVCHKIIRLFEQKICYYDGNYQQMKAMVNQERRKKEKEWEIKKKTIKSKKERKKQRIDEEYNVDFDFNYNTSQGDVQVNNISFGYNQDLLFDKVNFRIMNGEKIVIVGKNGVGKSTFLKLLTGELKPVEGNVDVKKGTVISKYYQHFEDFLPMDTTPSEFLQSFYNLNVTDARKHLSEFNLESETHTIPIEKCSGGQKSRIAFSTLALGNILILDEPTNHLDIETIEGLSNALREFEGGIVLVSHDAKLIRELDCSLYVCKDNQIVKYRGDFDQYREEVLTEIEQQVQQVTKKKTRNKKLENVKENVITSESDMEQIKALFSKNKKKKKKI